MAEGNVPLLPWASVSIDAENTSMVVVEGTLSAGILVSIGATGVSVGIVSADAVSMLPEHQMLLFQATVSCMTCVEVSLEEVRKRFDILRKLIYVKASSTSRI